MKLSKSNYMRGLQCSKRLWLNRYRPELRVLDNTEEVSKFETGFTVGEAAKQLFPGGVEIAFDRDDFKGMQERTRRLIEEGATTIYEASFSGGGMFVMVDILHKGMSGWEAYEVKASTGLKEVYIEDASVQWYCIKQAGFSLDKMAIVHINNSYTRGKELEIECLFSVEEITQQVVEKQAEVEQNLQNMTAVLASKEMPQMDIGSHCNDPYGCDLQQHCWQHIPNPSVFNLYRMNGSKKFALYYEGIVRYEDIPKDYHLNETQRLQVDALLNNSTHIDKGIIRDFLDTVKFPISFFDFETFIDPVPRFENQRPYQQMPFQYSLHIQHEDGRLEHKEFLGDERSDPRAELAARMLDDIPKSGSIMAFNKSFEISRIKELARLFPQQGNELEALVERFVDLIEPFRAKGYYHPDFNGSFSIKSVLPALFPNDPELDYKKLEIQNGGMAMDTFANLPYLKDPSEREDIRNALLAYCHLDTLAMVRIWEKLHQTVEENEKDLKD